MAFSYTNGGLGCTLHSATALTTLPCAASNVSWATKTTILFQTRPCIAARNRINHRKIFSHHNGNGCDKITPSFFSTLSPSSSSASPPADAPRQQNIENLGRSSSLNPKPNMYGHIDIVIGPMFAGKSSELLRRVAHYESLGLTVAIVKSNKDDRYSKTHVVTHNGDKKPCHAFSSLELFRNESNLVYSNADVIAIDEAQFFPDLLDFCTAAADIDRKRVILAGLDGDFMRKRFGQVLDLIPLADSVTKLTARCLYCHQEAGAAAANDGNGYASVFPAVFSLRVDADVDSEQELVGGAEKYAPVCRRHYVSIVSAKRK